MTPEQGHQLAEFQRPGFKVVMGTVSAADVRIKPLHSTSHLPGDTSWFEMGLQMSLGFAPSLFAIVFADTATRLGHTVTKGEWKWLHGRKCSLDAAERWIEEIGEGK